MDDEATYAVEAKVLGTSRKAILIRASNIEDDSPVEIWLPKSQSTVCKSKGVVEAPEWIWVSRAREHGVQLTGRRDGDSYVFTPAGIL